MATIQIRIDDKTKKSAQKTLDELGLDMSSAVKVYFRQIVIQKGIPFQIVTENGMTPEQEAEVLEASEEAKRGINVTRAMNVKKALAYLKNLEEKPKKHH